MARLSKNALMHGVTQYKEETYATPTVVVDKLPWPRYVERAVRVMNDMIFATRFGRTSTMSRGQRETLQSAHSGRMRLIRDFRPYHDVNLSQSMINSVDDQMPTLVSSASSTSSMSEAVYGEF